MKNLFLIFLISLLLSSCAPATVVPTSTETTTATSTETSTIIAPTRTPKPTSTPIPTTTSTPSLPTTIEFTFDKSIPETEQNQIKVIVDEAYWFYVNLGCSSDGFKSRFYNGEGGQADYTNGTWFEGGVASFQSQTSEVSTMISHEMVHAMCQIAFTKRSAMGAIDLRWLTEGVANYFSTMEQIENTGMNSGVKVKDISEHNRGMAEWVSENFCQIQISKLEPANAHEIYPNGFGAIADVATRLLVRTTPDGINAIIDYYTLLSTTPKSDAFYQAFGKTKEEFYQQYQDECSKGFPTVIK